MSKTKKQPQNAALVGRQYLVRGGGAAQTKPWHGGPGCFASALPRGFPGGQRTRNGLRGEISPQIHHWARRRCEEPHQGVMDPAPAAAKPYKEAETLPPGPNLHRKSSLHARNPPCARKMYSTSGKFTPGTANPAPSIKLEGPGGLGSAEHPPGDRWLIRSGNRSRPSRRPERSLWGRGRTERGPPRIQGTK